MQHRDEIIKVQINTLALLQNEVKNLKERESDVREVNQKQENDINLLRNRVNELENELRTTEAKATNLQVAVCRHSLLFYYFIEIYCFLMGLNRKVDGFRCNAIPIFRFM